MDTRNPDESGLLQKREGEERVYRAVGGQEVLAIRIWWAKASTTSANKKQTKGRKEDRTTQVVVQRKNA